MVDIRESGASLSGLEMLCFIRTEPALQGIRVLVLSAQGERELRSAVDAGADDTLAKPFANEGLLGKVATLLSQ